MEFVKVATVHCTSQEFVQSVTSLFRKDTAISDKTYSELMVFCITSIANQERNAANTEEPDILPYNYVFKREDNCRVDLYVTKCRNYAKLNNTRTDLVLSVRVVGDTLCNIFRDNTEIVEYCIDNTGVELGIALPSLDDDSVITCAPDVPMAASPMVGIH